MVSSLDQSKSERIYIGGLDPPRLCASDVLKRIQAIDQIEIINESSSSSSSSSSSPNNEEKKNSNEIIEKKPYLHITARSKNESSSALDIIVKQYHNVKWKGCKLSVEAAKPHFLERLEEERRQRMLIGTVEEEIVHKEQKRENHDDDKAINDNNIPRRLRVRKKYGEEAFHVDTKPWTVEDWTNFQRARNKLRKQCENHKLQQQEQEQVNKKQNTYGKDSKRSCGVHRLMHRAVHFRFLGLNKDYDDAIHENDVPHNNSSTSDDESSASSSSSSGEEEGDYQAETPAKNETSYQWSDDDDDDDDDDSEDENVIERFDVHQAVNQYDIDSSSNGDNSSGENEQKYELDDEEENVSSEDEATGPSSPQNLKEDDDGGDSTTEKNANEGKSELKSYQWSTDEEESDDDDENDDRKSFSKAGLLKTVDRAVIDEFAAGLDEDDETEDDEEDNLVDNGGKSDDVSRHESSLVEDVTANLNILTSIFPDMANARPASVNNDDDDDDNNKNYKLSNAKDDISGHQSGLKVGQVSGIIPRYDPTMDSSEKYTIKEKSPVVDNSSDKKESNGDLSSGSDDDSDNSENDIVEDETKSERAKEQQPVQNIYEQGKLESVFRDAREVWEKHPSHLASGQISASKQSTTSEGGGGFSFGFDLGETAEKEDNDPGAGKASSGFIFSFKIPGSTETTEISAKTSNMNGISEPEKQPDTAVDVEDDKKRIDELRTPRRKGLEFPQEDLQEYVNNFFSCNEGQKILITSRNDEEIHERSSSSSSPPFRYDDQEKQKWLNERESLTLDWKRKRKYAMTRIQKRMKVR
jgi:hypothetical protein